MTDEPLPALKPCPCCAGKLELHDNDWCEPVMWNAWCPGCGLHFKSFIEKREAIEAANRRSAGSEVREALTRLLGNAREAVSALDFAFEQGALNNETIKRLYVDPWGMLRDFKAAVDEAERALRGPR